MSNRAYAVSITLIAACLCSPAGAHDTKAVANPRFPVESRFASTDLEALIDNTQDPDARWIYQAALRWKPGSILKGCFMNGSSNYKRQVIQATSELLDNRGVNLKVDFMENQAPRNCTPDGAGFYPEDIRVEFGGGQGCAAEIGTVSKSKRPNVNGDVPAKSPSVFLDPGCMIPVTIKHELLHSFGFHHEHQKPGTPCRFKIADIAKIYGWDEATVRYNFNELKQSNAYVGSSGFDAESVMRYSFTQDFLETSDCVGGPGKDLSDLDWAGLQAAYPMNHSAASRAQRLSRRSSMTPTGNAVLDDLIAVMD